jgi:hypothetical protein
MNNNKNFFEDLNRLVSDVATNFELKAKAKEQELKFELNAYYHGESYEQDLDELLKSFECRIYKDRCFDTELSRAERIKLKEDHLVRKFGAFALEGAGKGAAVTFASKSPPIVTKAAFAGAGLHAGKVIAKAGEIIFKRLMARNKSKTHKLEMN